MFKIMPPEAFFPLETGAHPGPFSGLCFMEALSFIERQPHSDSCDNLVDPVVADVMRGLNDSLPDDMRQRLNVFLPAVVGSSWDSEEVLAKRRHLLENPEIDQLRQRGLVNCHTNMPQHTRECGWLQVVELIQAMLQGHELIGFRHDPTERRDDLRRMIARGGPRAKERELAQVAVLTPPSPPPLSQLTSTGLATLSPEAKKLIEDCLV